MSDLTNVIMNQKEIIRTTLNNLGKLFYRRNYIKTDKLDEQIIDEVIQNNMHNFELDGKKCTRETATFDTFVDSSWDFLRFCSSENSNLPFNNDEYSVMHPSLSKDETRLYFSSNMPGGFGGFEVLVC